MKQLLTIFFFLIGSFTYAQNISVSDFRLDEMDLTANQQGTTVLDQNGEKCALIKVITTQTGFTFDVGSLGVRKVEQKAGEIWVYIPHGVRKMSISHPQIGQLRDYTFPLTIARSRTYVMQLTTGEVQTVVKKSVTSQYVMFSVTPKNAVVELDGQIIEAIDGIASKRLPFGTYSYKVLSPRYSQSTGTVTVNDPKNKHVVNVVLQPQFSNFTFEVANNAEIWIDDQKKGTGRCTVELGYGTYMVETRLSNHRNALQEITLSDQNSGNTITLKAPTPIYGTLDINSIPGNAVVLLDNKEIGTTPMYIDECLVGDYELKIKREGYKDYITTITITEGETVNETATLNIDGKPVELNAQNLSAAPLSGDVSSDAHDPKSSAKNKISSVSEKPCRYRLRPHFEVAVGNYASWDDANSFDTKETSEFNVGIDFGYVFLSRDKINAGLFAGLGMTNTTIDLGYSHKGIYSYNASGSADVDGDTYIRRYSNLKLKQTYKLTDFTVPVYFDVEMRLLPIVSFVIDLGAQAHVNMSNKIESTTGSAYVDGYYPQYVHPIVNESWGYNNFGNNTYSNADLENGDLSKMNSFTVDVFGRAGLRISIPKTSIAIDLGAQYVYGVMDVMTGDKVSFANPDSEKTALIYNTVDGLNSTEHVRNLADGLKSIKRQGLRIHAGVVYKF